MSAFIISKFYLVPTAETCGVVVVFVVVTDPFFTDYRYYSFSFNKHVHIFQKMSHLSRT
jgi:hypothetical protein